MPGPEPTLEELQRAHDRVRRVLPPLAVALGKPVYAAVLRLGVAMQRKPPPKRHDPKAAACGNDQE